MAILMEESYWRNSQFSVARFYGGIQIKGWDSDDKEPHRLLIVNKHGITLRELSDPDSKHFVNDEMVIKPGEPADLVDEEFIKYYKALGREQFISILEKNGRTPRKKLHELYKAAVKEKRKSK